MSFVCKMLCRNKTQFVSRFKFNVNTCIHLLLDFVQCVRLVFVCLEMFDFILCNDNVENVGGI